MLEFSPYISKKWNIPKSIASKICEHFEKGDSIYYLSDYNPYICVELSISSISDIYNTLKNIQSLEPKKKRVINALKKANTLTNTIEKRINSIIDSIELDDMLLSCRKNPRSKGQKAIKQGLAPFADIFDKQEIEDVSINKLAKEYVGKDPSFKTVEDVLDGVKNILIEGYAHDETVRSMVRDVGFEDGFFEVLPKNKKDRRFISYRGKMVPVTDLTSEEYLTLCEAEEKKQIRFKHGIQLFHIDELLRHHFIENPDFIGFDFICEVIEECWIKVLQPMVEHDVKARLYKQAEDWALSKIDEDLQNKITESEALTSILAVAKYNDKNLVIVALNTKGHLLSATNEKIGSSKENIFSNRIKQFYTRYKPSRVIIMKNEFVDAAETVVQKTMQSISPNTPIERVEPSEYNNTLTNSKWMNERYSLLEDVMKETYVFGLSFLQPFQIIPQIGVKHFNFHPLQKFIKSNRLEQLLERKITENELHKGILYYEAPESLLKNIECVTDEILINIRKDGAKKPFNSKNSLLNIKGMTEVLFRNIAGYIIIPKAKNILDRTIVHPDHYELVNDISLTINASLESLVNNPDLVRGFSSADPEKNIFIAQKLVEQLQVGQRFQFPLETKKRRRKQRLSELKIGTVVSGRVTNITKFGVFVDINAVCDGLVHISQLANGYIETADQVVQPNEQIDVKILKIDKKKRRISLSMKKSGTKELKIRPSQGQLTNLADHFKNR
jgi:uncharacterized protein